MAEHLQSPMSAAATPIIFIMVSVKPGLRERAMELAAAAFLATASDSEMLADAMARPATWQSLTDTACPSKQTPFVETGH